MVGAVYDYVLMVVVVVVVVDVVLCTQTSKPATISISVESYPLSHAPSTTTLPYPIHLFPPGEGGGKRGEVRGWVRVG